MACELPLQAIAELIGVPQKDRAKIFDWSNKMIAYDDPQSLGLKADYVRANTLGGMMVWQLSADDAKYTLLQTLIKKLGL